MAENEENISGNVSDASPATEETAPDATATAPASANTDTQEAASATDADTGAASATDAGASAVEAESTEEITYHAVEKDGQVTAIWEMQGRKHLRTIDPRSRQGADILRLYTAEHPDEAGAPEAQQEAQQ